MRVRQKLTNKGSKIGLLEILIRKYDDEWFLVTIVNNVYECTDKDRYKYYKCDTFDGVKELISNNI